MQHGKVDVYLLNSHKFCLIGKYSIAIAVYPNQLPGPFINPSRFKGIPLHICDDRLGVFAIESKQSSVSGNPNKPSAIFQRMVYKQVGQAILLIDVPG